MAGALVAYVTCKADDRETRADYHELINKLETYGFRVIDSPSQKYDISIEVCRLTFGMWNSVTHIYVGYDVYIPSAVSSEFYCLPSWFARCIEERFSTIAKR
jgi:hypothetical protein